MAQVAAFADTEPGRSEASLIFEQGLAEITPANPVPAQAADRAGKVAQYLSFLRMVDGSTSPEVQGREKILNAYHEYQPLVSPLLASVADRNDTENDVFLGSGSNAAVYLLEKDCEQLAVRVPATKRHTAQTVDTHVGAALRAQGITGLEEIVAASYADGVTIAKRMPGKEIPHTSLDDVNAISTDQLRQFVNLLCQSFDAGIIIDFKMTNIFYDRAAGFGVVDLAAYKDYYATPMVLHNRIGAGQQVLLNMGGIQREMNRLATERDCASIAHGLETILPKLEEYGQVARELTGWQETALVDATRENIRNYRNPAWIAERVQEANTLLAKRTPVFDLVDEID